MKNGKRKLELMRQLATQRHWIDTHGETLSGYRANYGDSGDGWHAIWTADWNELRRLEALLEETK